MYFEHLSAGIAQVDVLVCFILSEGACVTIDSPGDFISSDYLRFRPTLMTYSSTKKASIGLQVQEDFRERTGRLCTFPDPPSSPLLRPSPRLPAPTPKSRRFWDIVMNPIDDAADDHADKRYLGSGFPGTRMVKGKEVAQAITEDEYELTDSELMYPMCATPPPVSSPPSSPGLAHCLSPSSLPSSPIRTTRPPNSASSTTSSGTLVSVRSSSSAASAGTLVDDSDDEEIEKVISRTFVCSLNGCRKVLPYDYHRVLAHIHHGNLHLGSIECSVKRVPCIVPGCSYSNPSGKRVAEHVLSRKHLNLPIFCDALSCDAAHSSSRQWSLKRHRDVTCRCCLGCPRQFITVKERKLHEKMCPDVPKAEAALKRKREQAQLDEPSDSRWKRRRVAPKQKQK
ncbi:hypothetical protein A7U60_g4671 [Sanghuangporus baumii]|uniref:Uncharacterized protein n=1 Tax=Sanghuangporus baumii TaxID=108892 RepID=A0A9Q5HYM5_SANBA|nr:hypothetical protein A7U60_g4671 [Sanghuangporus baumii]